MSVNAYLINTGSKLVLIDAGSGNLFGPTVGKLMANLKASGYQPEQVDEIYITHMHADHVGGLVAGSQIAFPNAIVRADQREADFWLSKANMDAAPKDAKQFFEGAMASINPYIAAGKFKPFNGNTDLMPGIKAVATRGHTPGHARLRGRKPRSATRAVGRSDARSRGAVSRAFGDNQVRHRFESRRRAAQGAIRRCG